MGKMRRILFWMFLCISLLLFHVPQFAAADERFESGEGELFEAGAVDLPEAGAVDLPGAGENELFEAGEDELFEADEGELFDGDEDELFGTGEEAFTGIGEDELLETGEDEEVLAEEEEAVVMDPAAMAAGPIVLTGVEIQVTAPRGDEVSSNGRADSHVSVPKNADYTVEWASWASMSDGDLHVYADEGEELTFVAGETYYLKVTLKAEDGYDFFPTMQYQSDAAEVTGANFEYIEDVYNNNSTGYSALLLVASVVADEPLYTGVISDAEVTVTPPVAGRTTAAAPVVSVPANRGCSVASAAWCTETGVPLDQVVYFENGETYYLSVTLTADPGCCFREGNAGEGIPGTNVTVDGGTLAGDVLIVNEVNGDGSLVSSASMIIGVTPEEAPAGVILDVNLGFTPPAGGDEIAVTFSGKWNEEINYSPYPAVTIPAGAPFSMSAYFKGQAHWVKPDDGDYTIYEQSFAVNGGDVYYAAVLLNHASGYHFDSTYTVVSMENASLVDWEIEDGLLYAIFAFTAADTNTPPDEVCTIRFDANGGTGNMQYYTRPEGQTLALPACLFEKAGRTFAGWSVNGAFMKQGDEITVTEDVTVKALWSHGGYAPVDASQDNSTTIFKGKLLLTDTLTEEVHTREIDCGSFSSKFIIPYPAEWPEEEREEKLAGMAAAAKTELEDTAGTIAGDSPVTAGELQVEGPDGSINWDNRKFTFIFAGDPALDQYMDEFEIMDAEGDYLAGSFFVTDGDYGHKWVYTFLLEASYEGTGASQEDECPDGHTYVEVPESAGNIRYWTCGRCGKFFVDPDGGGSRERTTKKDLNAVNEAFAEINRLQESGYADGSQLEMAKAAYASLTADGKDLTGLVPQAAKDKMDRAKNLYEEDAALLEAFKAAVDQLQGTGLKEEQEVLKAQAAFEALKGAHTQFVDPDTGELAQAYVSAEAAAAYSSAVQAYTAEKKAAAAAAAKAAEDARKAEAAKFKLNVKNGQKNIPIQLKKSNNKIKAVTLGNGDKLKSAVSSNPKFVTASVKGNTVVLKGLKVKKSATITVTTELGGRISFSVKVQKGKVLTRKIKVTRKTLKVGETYDLIAEITPVTTGDKLTFASSNKKIAKVGRKNGKITARKTGKVKITVKSGKKKKTVTFVVSAK